MIDIFGFQSPLDFLEQLLNSEKAHRKDFSLDKMAETLGLSRSALSMVLSGKRNITNSLIHSLARELKFSESEHLYWEALVHFHQAENDTDKIWFQKKLTTVKSERRTTSIRTPAPNLVSAWYVPAILVYLIDLSQGSASEVVSEVATKLSLPTELVRNVIEKLEGDGFLQFKGGGDVHVFFDRISASVSSKRFLKDVMAEANRRIDTDFESRDSFFTSHTFSIEKRLIPEFIQDYKNLLQRYLDFKSRGSQSESNSAEVVLTSFQLFPALAKG